MVVGGASGQRAGSSDPRLSAASTRDSPDAVHLSAVTQGGSFGWLHCVADWSVRSRQRAARPTRWRFRPAAPRRRRGAWGLSTAVATRSAAVESPDRWRGRLVDVQLHPRADQLAWPQDAPGLVAHDGSRHGARPRPVLEVHARAFRRAAGEERSTVDGARERRPDDPTAPGARGNLECSGSF